MSRPESIRVIWPKGSTELRLADGTAASNGNLAARLADAGHPLNTRCARQGTCAGCTVRLVAGAFNLHDGRTIHAPAEIKACQGEVSPGEPAVIAVPARSMMAHRPEVVTSFRAGISAAQLPLVAVVPGFRDYGFAIDIGTTTVVVALVDLLSGRILAEESAFNRQIEMGDNVLTRIQLAGSMEHREALREAVITHTLTPLALDVCAAGGIAPARVAVATVAGNTTMLHLLTGTDPTPMGVAPFVAPFTRHRILTASELQWPVLRPDTAIHLLPGFSSYVGADLVAGSVCSGLLHDPGPAMLVDVGTNGEILLKHGDHLSATATAAGPAFEGGRLTCGTRAVAGAIAHVAFPDRSAAPQVEIIPGADNPIGLCGSAYIDFLAQARSSGLLTPHGRFERAAWQALAPAHRHVAGWDCGVQLCAGEPCSVITEADIAQLLQAKAAIAAGILLLLRRTNLEAADIKRLYLAGGFGLHLDVNHAIACGLLPGFTSAQIEVVGNTSLGGAWLALNDQAVLAEMTTASRKAEIIELNLEPDFEDTFIDQLTLP